MSTSVLLKTVGERHTIEKGVNDELAITFDEVVDIAENSTVTGKPQCPDPRGRASTYHMMGEGNERHGENWGAGKIKIKGGRGSEGLVEVGFQSFRRGRKEGEGE